MIEPHVAAAREALDADDRFTAVVHFHGIGNQRRYEEVSRLVDALDQFIHRSFADLGVDRGLLQRVRARLEPPHDDADGEIGFIAVRHSRRGEAAEWRDRSFRFYEVYWAPLTAGGTKLGSVLNWLLVQVTVPVKVLLSQWRDRQRLRRSALIALWNREGRPESLRRDVAKLLQCYDEFEGYERRRRYGKDFAAYCRYVRARWERRPVTVERLLRLARRWRRTFILGELAHLLKIALLLGVLGLGLWRLQSLAADFSLGNLGWAGLAWAVNGAIGWFLVHFLGDVQQWCTYQETDVKHARRQEILERGVQTLRHVLEHPGCARVVITSHSLGTAIAMDSLLELGRHNRARWREDVMLDPLPLWKLDRFVTYGSPIDKIHYFFESHTGKNHRYNRVVEEIRGDIGTPPFAINRGADGGPWIRWLNLWDRCDPVGGTLESPTNRKWWGLQLENVEVRNVTLRDPVRSHTAYLDNEVVLERVYGEVFGGAWGEDPAGSG